MSNLRTHGLNFCCGMTELGNFNYDDPPGTPQMTHYHKISGWVPQSKHAEHTTEKEIRAQIQYVSGGVLCTTGAGQEYVEPILAKIGFKHVFTYTNPGHANTDIKVWCYAKTEKPLGG